MKAFHDFTPVMGAIPKPEDPVVRRFVDEQIGRGLDIVSVPISVPPELPSDRHGECYWNVEYCRVNFGAEPVHGWSIMLWDGFFIQAIHHAVCRLPTGELVDPSLAAYEGQVARTFVADGPIVDFRAGERLNLRSQILTGNAAVKRAMTYLVEFDAWRHNVSRKNYSQFDISVDQELQFRHRTMSGLIDAAFHSVSRGNSQCLCGSGKKYKKCHAL